MSKKIFSIRRSIMVLFLTIIIFSLGIIVGNYNSYKKFDQVIDLSEELKMETLGLEVQYEILKENICEKDGVFYLTGDIFELSKRLNYLEETLGKNNPNVIDLKNYYFILQAKHWLLTKEKVKTCMNGSKTINSTIVLYFYSNMGDCEKCEQQGTVLTYFRNKYPGIKVYSFDINSENIVVKTLKKIYEIRGISPSIVLNEELYEGYTDKQNFIELMQQQGIKIS